MRLRVLIVVSLVVLGVVAALAVAAPPGTNTVVSRPSGFGPLTTPITNESVTTPAGEASSRTVSDGADHRFVAFVSDADGLSTLDDDRARNVYVRDRETNTTTLVSRADGVDGAGGNGNSTQPAISSNGRYVAFSSNSNNLVPAAGDSTRHIYVRDLRDGVTTLVDRADGLSGNVANAGSADPALTVVAGVPVVAFTSSATNLDGAVPDFSRQVYVRSGTDTTMVSRRDSLTPPNANTPGDGVSRNPSISTDGTTVAFEGDPDNLVSNDTNNADDVFVRVLAAGSTKMASASSLVIGDNDSSGASISADGNRVAFASRAKNLLLVDTDATSDIYVKDMLTEGLTLASRATDGTKADAPVAEPAISDSGSTVVFSTASPVLVPGDTNGAQDVFAREGVFTGTPETTRVSRPSAAVEADGASMTPSISRLPDGGGDYLVAYSTGADNLGTDDDNDFGQVYAQELGPADPAPEFISRPTGTGIFRSGVNGSWLRPSNRDTEVVNASSQDGRYTVFLSESDELSDADDNRYVNVFRRDNLTGDTILVSRADGASGAAQDGNAAGSSGGIGAAPGGSPAISADGNRITFVSTGTNLVAGDSNGVSDAFVRDVTAQTTVRASVQSDGSQIPTSSADASISGDGTHVAFVTGFAIAGNDTNGDSDVYVRDLGAGSTVLVSRIDPNGNAGDSDSSGPVLNATGDRIAFESGATNLVPGLFDTNASSDVFMRDLTAGKTRAVSVNPGTTSTGNESSFAPVIDAAGDSIAFSTLATDLVADPDANGTASDVALRDVGAGTTAMLSVTAGGATGNSGSDRASMSSDGTRIAFETSATNLVGPDTNGDRDVVVRDPAAGTTIIGARTADGAQIGVGARTPSISGDGNCLFFETSAPTAFGGAIGADFSRVIGRALRGDCPFGPVAEPSATPTPTATATATSTATVSPTPTATAEPDTTAPVLTKVKLRPKRFRAGKRSRLSFTLSERASVTMRVKRLRPKPAKGRGKASLGSFPAGPNTAGFRGKARGRKLKRGRYQGIVRATDVAGNVSAPRRVRFKIRPPAPR